MHSPIDPRPHFLPSTQTALFKFAPSKLAFKILAPVKSASKRLLSLKVASIKDAPLKLTRVKFALVKFAFSKLPPSRFASYQFTLKNEDSAKFPLAKLEFIIMLLSNITLIKLINDKLEFGIYARLKSCPSEN